MGKNKKGLRQIPAEEFVRRLRMMAGRDDTHFAFWLGAGCSVSSGIPSAATLVADRWLPRLHQIRGVTDKSVENWAVAEFPGYDSSRLGAIYGAVMGELFIQPEARQREVENLCDGRSPGFGYGVLAALLSRKDGLFNVALTTNFDDLIADAMYVFTEARPLVIHDELLAGFIRPTRMRPLVVKVHGDHRLSPRNTDNETEKLKRGISEGIGNLLHDRGVIFVGYGGNDIGIAELLASLPPKALPLGVWWASRTEPEGVLREWLEEREAVWVQIPGFDELMLLFKSEFEIPNPSSSKFEQIFDSYLHTYRELEKEVVRIPDSDPQASALKDAAARSEASTDDWMRPYMQAARAEEDDPARAEEILVKAMDEFPQAVQLVIALARLLIRTTHYEDALHWSQKAVDLNPQAVDVMRVRGQALAVSGHMDEALKTYRDLIDEDPDDLLLRAQYGSYSARDGDLATAERELAWLVKANTDKYPGLIGLLADEVGDHRLAAKYHQQAIRQSPRWGASHAYYARCLILLGQPEEALKEIEIAHETLPAVGVAARLGLFFNELVVASPARRKTVLTEIKRMIGEGARLSTWTFSGLLEASKEMEGPDPNWLEHLAAVIRGQEDPGVLDEWKEWRAA